MPVQNVGDDIIRAFTMGRQMRLQQEDLARREEDRQLERETLKHRLTSLKLQEKANEWAMKRGLAQERLQYLSSLPASQQRAFSPAASDVEPTARVGLGEFMGGPMSDLPLPQERPSVTRPGFPEWGIEPETRQAGSLEETLARKMAADRMETLNKAYVTSVGQRVSVPTIGVIAEGGKKPTTYKDVNVLINGKVAKAGYDDETNTYWKDGKNVTKDVTSLAEAPSVAADQKQYAKDRTAYEDYVRAHDKGQAGRARKGARTEEELAGMTPMDRLAAEMSDSATKERPYDPPMPFPVWYAYNQPAIREQALKVLEGLGLDTSDETLRGFLEDEANRKRLGSKY